MKCHLPSYTQGSHICNDTDIRLVDGRTEFEGRVEICLGSIWRPVCDNMWDDADAAVVCRQLGFTSDGKSDPLNSVDLFLQMCSCYFLQ